jgi:hypothetical protein
MYGFQALYIAFLAALIPYFAHLSFLLSNQQESGVWADKGAFFGVNI